MQISFWERHHRLTTLTFFLKLQLQFETCVRWFNSSRNLRTFWSVLLVKDNICWFFVVVTIDCLYFDVLLFARYRAHGFGSVEFSIWQSHKERSLKITCKMCFHPWLGLYILLVGIILNGGKKQAFFFIHRHSESNLMSLGVSNSFKRESIFSHGVARLSCLSKHYLKLLLSANIYLKKNDLPASASASPFFCLF